MAENSPLSPVLKLPLSSVPPRATPQRTPPLQTPALAPTPSSSSTPRSTRFTRSAPPPTEQPTDLLGTTVDIAPTCHRGSAPAAFGDDTALGIFFSKAPLDGIPNGSEDLPQSSAVVRALRLHATERAPGIGGSSLRLANDRGNDDDDDDGNGGDEGEEGSAAEGGVWSMAAALTSTRATLRRAG
jgi:hypothetical protein